MAGQTEISILKDLRDMQAALEEMAVKVKGMIRCVLGKEVMGQSLGLGSGLESCLMKRGKVVFGAGQVCRHRGEA